MAGGLKLLFILFAFLSLVALPISSQATSNTAPATFAGSPIPTPIPGDNTYTLLGCYVEPPASSGHRALGSAGTYITPSGIDANSLSIEQCLKACATTLGSTGTDAYLYAGLENANECYCSSVLLTNATHIVSSGFCTSPCTGDSTTACGGYGYVDVYQLTSNIHSNSSSSSPTTTLSSGKPSSASISLVPTSPSTLLVSPSTISTSSTPTVTSSKSKSSLSGGAIAGIVIGSIAGVLILILCCCCFRRRLQKKQNEKSQPSPHPISITGTPGFINSDPRRNGVIYPSDSASPKPWEIRDPDITPYNSHVGANPYDPPNPNPYRSNTSTSTPLSRPLGFFRDGSQRRQALERWKSGGPSELEGDGERSGEQSNVNTFNSSDLLEGFNEMGGRERIMSWRTGDDEALKRGYGNSMSNTFSFVGQDRAELPEARKEGVANLGRANSQRRVEVTESPVLGRETAAGRVEGVGEGAEATAAGGWSLMEAVAIEGRVGIEQKKIGKS